MSIEPRATTFGITSETKARSLLARTWCVKPYGETLLPIPYSFYVLGNGNVYAYGNYLTLTLPSDNIGKDIHPIERASEMISHMNGYFLDTREFEGVTPEEIESSGNVKPEALEGILLDMERSRTATLVAEELEEVLPEAVRHDSDGLVGINYNAVVTVLVEAFKEQQARIEQLEAILRENNMLK